ncbi:MAG: DUF2326 domain-containing protein [Acidobacteria bacterium]|nr:DUF2326 domain-containing protein [Acidobacteriota bacterium]
MLEAADNRKKVALLAAVRRICAEYDLQYVLTLIDSDLPRNEHDNRLLFAEAEIVRDFTTAARRVDCSEWSGSEGVAVARHPEHPGSTFAQLRLLRVAVAAPDNPVTMAFRRVSTVDQAPVTFGL